MDGESSYESDISESWSLIDINLNEESPPAPSASETPSSELKNERLEKQNEPEVDEFARKCEERNKTDSSRVSDSECGSSLRGEESFSRTDDKKQNSFSDDDGKNDSGDNESVEILELDGDYQDSELDVSGIEQLDISTYQSDDEESLEKNNNENSSNNSTVIRRRKRLSRSLADTVNNANSENEEACTNVEVNEELIRGNSSVYKHYRNNVVNTVLSLSVGVIFAGVACLAIGHFLGVQEATETAVELTETLKKLQAENAALHSALLTLETNSKLELPLNQPEEAPHEQIDPSKTQKTELNNAALSAVRSSVNSIEWLSKLQTFVGKNKLNEKENGVDVNGLGKFVVDQVHSLNRRMEDGAKFFEDADKKISKYLRKIMKRLSSSQDSIEVLHERLIHLKDVLNDKLITATYPAGETVQKRVPVTELELQTMQWKPENKLDKSVSQGYRKTTLFYNFPQPKKFYENKIGKELELNSNRTEESEKEVNKKRRSEEKVNKNGKKTQKKDKSNKRKKGDEKRKSAVKKLEKVLRKLEKSRKKDEFKPDLRQVGFNVTKPQSKKYTKPREKTAKHKRKCKKNKHSKQKQVLIQNLKSSSSKKRPRDRSCSRPQCTNLTGHWVFKWADGRDEIRRHQAVGEWQFDRAKARRELRDNNYDENWQFKRAVAREYNRWNRGKYEKYLGKDFFHETFSWI